MAGLMFTSMQGSPGPNINNRLTCLTPDRGHTNSTLMSQSQLQWILLKALSFIRLPLFRYIVKAENIKEKRKNFAYLGASQINSVRRISFLVREWGYLVLQNEHHLSLFFPSISYLVAAGTLWCQTEIINKRKIHFCLLSSALCKVEHITTALYYWLERVLGPGENTQLEGSNDILQSLPSLDVLEMKAVSPHPEHAAVAERGNNVPGPESGLLSNTQKWIVQGDTYWQSKEFIGNERAPGGRAGG